MVGKGFGPAKLNPLPETVNAEIVRLDFPVLVIVTGRIGLLPTCTLPKFTLVGDVVIAIWALAAPVTKKKERSRRLQ